MRNATNRNPIGTRFLLHGAVLSALLLGLPLLGQAQPDTLKVTTSNSGGDGSLRWAITQANNRSGPNVIVFEIPAQDSGFKDGWWTITVDSELPSIRADGIEILGFTQTQRVGDENVGVVGTGGTVGVDEVPLPQFERPEIAIDANGNVGLQINAGISDVLIEGLVIYNATDGILFRGSDFVSGGTNRQVRKVLIGVMPDGTDPGEMRNTRNGIRLVAASEDAPSELTVDSSYVGFNGEVGIVGERGASKLNVKSCEVFGNGWATNFHDGIDVNGSDGEVMYNLSRDNINAADSLAEGSGGGIEAGATVGSAGNNRIENNTVTGNRGAGIDIRFGSSGNMITRNIVTDNGVGVSVNIGTRLTTDANLISENSTFSNEGLGIDLHAWVDSTLAFDGITLNSPESGLAGSNLLQSFPVIDDAVFSESSLTITGFSSPGATIEFFVPDGNEGDFGEGSQFLFSLVEGSDMDTDNEVGTYGPVVSGVTVSTEAISTNRFSFTLDLPIDLPDSLLTATATVENNTSEFGPTVKTRVTPIIPDAVHAEDVPSSFQLHAAYPNPFNPSTTISFDLEQPARADLRVYALNGTQVATLVDRVLSNGTYRISWNADGLPSGVYIYRLEVGDQIMSRKAVLLR